MDKRVYWVHLQRCLNACAVLEGFMEKYGSAENFYNLGPEEWKNCGIKGVARKANESLIVKALIKAKRLFVFAMNIQFIS